MMAITEPPTILCQELIGARLLDGRKLAGRAPVVAEKRRKIVALNLVPQFTVGELADISCAIFGKLLKELSMPLGCVIGRVARHTTSLRVVVQSV